MGNQTIMDGERGYPKRLVLHPDQPNKALWERYLEDMYLSECARLGYRPDPKQEVLL